MSDLDNYMARGGSILEGIKHGLKMQEYEHLKMQVQAGVAKVKKNDDGSIYILRDYTKVDPSPFPQLEG